MEVPKERRRKRCLKCREELSHAAYMRHQNPVVCPDRELQHATVLPVHLDLTRQPMALPENTGTLESRPQAQESNVEDWEDEFTQFGDDEGMSGDRLPEDAESDQESDGSREALASDEDDVEDFDGPTPDGQSNPQEDSSKQVHIRKITVHMCAFITFFQLCYRVSERGISMLLAFLRCLLLWVYSLCHSEDLKLLLDNMPPNVYFLRKLVGGESNITSYVSCPKCHSIYKYSDCVVHTLGRTESKRCPFVEFPNHPHMSRRAKCDAVLLRKVKHKNSTKLVPRKVYAYISLVSSLCKLCNQTGFLQKCEHWRNRQNSSLLLDVYDGKVWKAFQNVNGRPFLSLPNNLCLKLNLDWFNPFDHVQYSIGVFYLVVENLPRSERYKLENIIILGTIPGPKEPKKNVNTYLKPLIDDLLLLWRGTMLKTGSSLFGVTPLRCALTCVTCDLPATRKICGFTSFSSTHGCSKCTKEFHCAKFGEKADYSGYNRAEWIARKHSEHMKQVSEVLTASTATGREQVEKKYGVRYSELLRLPYFDIVEYHVIDPMHNLLLGTAKHMVNLWKELKLLNDEHFQTIQDRVDQMEIPTKVGRIPHKISSNFSSFTADQWKNWMFIYSLYSLYGILPMEHYTCWSLFVDACHYLLQPSLTLQDLHTADEKLVEFANSFEILYGKEHTTPNMHMHLHIKDSILNYGPVYAFWCFPFERFNGVLGSFQKNWVSPELQMIKKFLTYQHLLLSDLPTSMPKELHDFFQLQLGQQKQHTVSEGSVEESHVDVHALMKYMNNAVCPLPDIQATELTSCMSVFRRYQKFFDHVEVSWLMDVYHVLYPGAEIDHVPMVHERFNEVIVLGERFLSGSARGKHSAVVCAYWSVVHGTISSDYLPFGTVLYFFRHAIHIKLNGSSEKKKVFARINWYKQHPWENWFHPRLTVISPDTQNPGPSEFIPLSRILGRCALIRDTVKFDYGEDNVLIAVRLSRGYFV